MGLQAGHGGVQATWKALVVNSIRIGCLILTAITFVESRTLTS